MVLIGESLQPRRRVINQNNLPPISKLWIWGIRALFLLFVSVVYAANLSMKQVETATPPCIRLRAHVRV